jgi:hypothetical protein
MRWRGAGPGVLLAGAILLPGCGGSAPEGLPPELPRNPAPLVEGETYVPEIHAANFVHRIDNAYFPLIPGTVRSYEGRSGKEIETERYVVTHRTKTILGISTTVVRDQVFIDGELAEDTYDWFAQDRYGNVWYFGEASHDIENGKVVSTKGSWEAGVDGALPGIVMLGQPQVGDQYRQEFFEGEAEDTAKIVDLAGSVKVPAGSYDEVLITEDRNPLDPGVVERKYYAPGIGVVFEELIEGDEGFLELVDITSA